MVATFRKIPRREWTGRNKFIYVLLIHEDSPNFRKKPYLKLQVPWKLVT
jgi:hypothetical protein